MCRRFSPSREYGLAVPLKTHDTAWNPSEKDIKVVMDLELDGAWVESASSPGGQRWDTSKVGLLPCSVTVYCAAASMGYPHDVTYLSYDEL